jgi:hypothetical protein
VDLLKCLAVFAEDAVLVFGAEGVENGKNGMNRVRVVYEAVKGVPIYRDLAVLWMRSGGNGREEDGAEKEALEKHGDGVWRRWASERPDPQESALIRGGERCRGRRAFWVQSTQGVRRWAYQPYMTGVRGATSSRRRQVE